MNWKQLARVVVEEIKTWADERFADVEKVKLLTAAEVRGIADVVEKTKTKFAELERAMRELKALPAPTVKLDGVAEMVTAAVHEWFRANPPPIPKDGTSVSVEDLQPFLQAGLAKWQLEFERHASGVFERFLGKLRVPDAMAPTDEQVAAAVAKHFAANPAGVPEALVSQCIDAWFKKNPPPVLEALEAPPAPSAEELRAAALGGFKEAAAEWLEKNPPRDTSPEAIETAVEKYMAAHPLPQLDADLIAKAALDVVAARVDLWLAQHPPAPGEKGPGPTVEEIAAAVDLYLKANPPPARGPTPEELAPVVAEYLRAHPPEPGKPGEPVAAEAIAAAVAEHLEKHPPAAGKAGDPGPEPSDERIARAVAEHLERHPPPAGPGPTAEAIGDAVASHLRTNPPAAGRAPTSEEIADAVAKYLEANPPAPGKPGDKGDKGDDGHTPDAAELDAAVVRHLKAHPIPVPANGKDASEEQIAAAVGAYLKAHPPADGRSVTDDEVAGAVAAYIASHPPTNGKDGHSVTLADVTPWLEQHGAQWALEFERRAQDLLRAVADKIPLPADGKDGLRVTDLKLEMSADGRTLSVILEDGERRHVATVRGKWPIYQGVFSDSVKYVEGDCVTFGGSMWCATKDEPVGRPGSVPDWKLSVKHGRDAPKKSTT